MYTTQKNKDRATRTVLKPGCTPVLRKGRGPRSN